MGKYSSLFGFAEIYPNAAQLSTNTPEARGYLDRVADMGKTYAQSIAPVDTGQYRDSFDSQGTAGLDPEAIITNADPIWYYLEYGTIHNRPFRVLSKALMHVADSYELT
jgi:HK97 gp10 family phage protein